MAPVKTGDSVGESIRRKWKFALELPIMERLTVRSGERKQQPLPFPQPKPQPKPDETTKAA